MEMELKAILKIFSKMNELVISKKFNTCTKENKIKNRKIIIAKAGVGTVNAALTTAFIAEKQSIDGILLLGVAGALQDFLQIGDIVLSNKILQHDCFFSGEKKREYMAPGELFVSLNLKKRKAPEFIIDKTFLNWLEPLILSKVSSKVYKGTIMSGNEFVGNIRRKINLSKEDAKALAVEMEAAGVAQVATKLGIPFAVVKTIADRLYPDGAVRNDYNKFKSSAAKTAAELINLIIHSS